MASLGGFILAAGLTAVMVGVFRIVMALAGMGMLVNFISDSVIIGFTAGAGIWLTTRGDARIMIITLLATLFLPLQFAVLTGILMSLAHYIIKSSMPQVRTVLPDSEFRHFIPQPNNSNCPQIEIIEIFGDLYFGACNHIEETIFEQLRKNPAIAIFTDPNAPR